MPKAGIHIFCHEFLSTSILSQHCEEKEAFLQLKYTGRESDPKTKTSIFKTITQVRS